MAFGECVRGLLEQHQRISAGERVSVHEVDLVLAVRVFVVGLEHVEPAAAQALGQLGQKGVLAWQALQVVRRFGQAVLRIGRFDAVRAPTQQEELGFDAGLHVPATLGEPRDLAPQHLARASLEGLAGHETVADDAGVTGHPRQSAGRERIAAAVVLGARAHARQAGAGDRRPRKTSAGAQHRAQVPERHQLAFGHAVNVGELRDQRVHALGGQRFLQALNVVVADLAHASAARIPARSISIASSNTGSLTVSGNRKRTTFALTPQVSRIRPRLSASA